MAEQVIYCMTLHGRYQVMWVFGEQNKNGFTTMNMARIGNPDLKWERSNEFNIGLESMMLDNRLRMEANFFMKYAII